jgi:hypothetical protein
VPVATDNSSDNNHIYNTVQWVSIKDKCNEYEEQAHDQIHSMQTLLTNIKVWSTI